MKLRKFAEIRVKNRSVLAHPSSKFASVSTKMIGLARSARRAQYWHWIAMVVEGK